MIAIDLQQEAIEMTKRRLNENLPEEILRQIHFLNQSHESYPTYIKPLSVNLIVYNLGYLPGKDKSITTLRRSTLNSLQEAFNLIKPGGAISITCYPGHGEGELETEAIKTFLSTLDARTWNCCSHQWINRINSPQLLFLQRANDSR